MTKTFERFLRSLSDEDLRWFADEREAVRPPYWPTLRLALTIEMSRRSLERDARSLDAVVSNDAEVHSRSITA